MDEPLGPPRSMVGVTWRPQRTLLRTGCSRGSQGLTPSGDPCWWHALTVKLAPTWSLLKPRARARGQDTTLECTAVTKPRRRVRDGSVAVQTDREGRPREG